MPCAFTIDDKNFVIVRIDRLKTTKPSTKGDLRVYAACVPVGDRSGDAEILSRRLCLTRL
jgi:hypothetical protein